MMPVTDRETQSKHRWKNAPGPGIWTSQTCCEWEAKAAKDTQNETPGWSQRPEQASRSGETWCTTMHYNRKTQNTIS